MIKYLIVEDESLSCQELKRMIARLRPGYKLEGWTENMAQTIGFLKNNRVDLILMNMDLPDGEYFQIPDPVRISIPVIFTTACAGHPRQAFNNNGIDYLVKPVAEEELARALDKYEQTYRQYPSPMLDYKHPGFLISGETRERFLVKSKDSYSYVESRDIAFFYSEDKVVFLHTFADKRYIIDYTLDSLEQQLAVNKFFRVSRNCISNIKAIQTIDKYLNGRLKITFRPACPHEVLVSRVRVTDFLQWMDGIIQK